MIAVAFISYSCSKESDVAPADDSTVVKSRLLDFGNSKSANDIFVSLEVTTRATEGRLFVSTTEDVEESLVEGLKPNQYLPFTPTGSVISVSQNLPSTLVDIQNGVIESGSFYLYMAILQEGTLRKILGPFSVNLSSDPIFAGNYTGTWNDNLYTNFPISARLTTETFGTFFYSPNFQSCCSGTNDGTVSFQIDDKVIGQFTYNQHLNNFMGGECPGTYQGSGVVKLDDGIQFEIKFTGSDCEGAHTNGRIVLTKR